MKAFAELCILSQRFVLRMRWRRVGSVSDRTPSPPSLSQADGIHSSDTMALMERGARALQVLHLLSEFAGLSVPIRVSEWQKDGGRDGIVGAGDAGEDAGEESGEQQSK